MEEQLKGVIEIVEKREKEQWEQCQILHERFGSGDKISELALARWYAWNEMKYLLQTIKI